MLPSNHHKIIKYECEKKKTKQNQFLDTFKSVCHEIENKINKQINKQTNRDYYMMKALTQISKNDYQFNL